MTLPLLPLPPSPKQLLNNLPRYALQPLIHSPFLIQRLALQVVFRQVFRESIADDEFEFLRNKVLKVEIKDMKLCWYFSFNGKQITVHRHTDWDVCISGEFHEFLLLATRQEDPDTLFFQRRLQIDGDTELGLELKNVLDSLELNFLNSPFPLRTILNQLPTVSHANSK